MTKKNWGCPSMLLGIRAKLLISFSLLFSVIFACSYYWLYRSRVWQVVEHLRLEIKELAVDITETIRHHESSLEYPFLILKQPQERFALYQDLYQLNSQTEDPYQYQIWGVVPAASALLPDRDYSPRTSLPSCHLVLLIDSLHSQPVADRIPLAVECTPIQQKALRSGAIAISTGTRIYAQNDSLTAYIPLKRADQSVYALLEVHTSTRHIQQMQASLNDEFVVVSLVCYGVLFALVYWFATVLARPLVRLKENAARIGEGNYDLPLLPETNQHFSDEISALDAVLRKMAQKIRDREQHLQTLQERQENMLNLLRESEERLHIIVQSTSDGILILDAEGHIQFANAAACRLFDRPLDTFLSHPLGIPLAAAPRTEIEIPLRTGELRIGEMSVSSTVWNGKDMHIASIRDVTDRKQDQKRLIHNALYDSLTQLPNRTYLMFQLRRLVQHLQERKKSLAALLFIDLDEFKVVNDSLGHIAGDRLLIEIGKRLSAYTSHHCFVARLGGDEFAMLVYPVRAVEEVYVLAERVLAGLRRPLQIPDHEQTLYIGASIGITLTPNPATQQAYVHPLDMLRDADTAMYCAKRSGKNRYELFNRQMYVNVRTRLALETALRNAIETDTLSLCYQPIFNLETGQLRSFEALLRWHHRDHGWVAPNEFIPIAEETGLIIPIGQWVLQTACRQLWQWQRENLVGQGVMMSVNLAGKQFLQPTLTDEICSTLNQIGLKTANLLLEVTESAIGTNLERVTHILNPLKDMGIRVAIDDFGTGYSSLSRLHQLPVDCLKIDQSFIARMTDSQENQEFVQAIVRFAQVLHIDVIAEGIETSDQQTILQQMNCNYGQGYLYAKPLTAEQTTELLRNLSTLSHPACPYPSDN